MVCIAEAHEHSGKYVSNMLSFLTPLTFQNPSPFSQEGNASSLTLWIKLLSGDAYPLSFILSSRLEHVPARI